MLYLLIMLLASSVYASSGDGRPSNASGNGVPSGATGDGVVRDYDGGGAAELWTPAAITSTAWYDASDLSTITETDGSVSQWDDKSGNDRHMFQVTESKQPTTGTNTIGGLNALYFDGGDAMGTNNWGESASEWSVYVVANALSASAALRYYFDTDAGRMIIAQTKSGTPSGPSAYDGSFKSIQSGFTGEQIVSYMAGDGGGVYTNGSLGVSIPTWTDKGIGGATSLGSTTVQNGTFISAYMGEFIIVRGLQSTADQQIMEGYLAWKWGLEGDLPTGHPYKDGAPTL